MRKQIESLAKKAGFLLLITTMVVGCNKYRYDFNDGTPGDGELNPDITVDTSIKSVDVSKYAQARVFPGLVCATEPRLNNVTVNLDLNYHFVGDDLRISVPPQAQVSTGYYAAPGELIIIDVPAGNNALSVQIGAWTDNLNSIINPPRDPIIFSRSQLAPGRNYMRNLYGGPIYIFAGRPIETPVPLTFTNVVKSPDFVLGVTTDAEWQTAVRNSCVPWVEFRSKNIIFTVPREYCVSNPVASPTTLMTAWDRSINLDIYGWEGLQENPVEKIDKAPLLPWRIVQDIKPVAGYAHSGYPVVAQNDLYWYKEFTELEQLEGGGCWGTFHEIGHNNQQTRYWSWSTLGETTCNLFVFKTANRMVKEGKLNAWPPVKVQPGLYNTTNNALAFANATGTKNFDGTDVRINDPFSRLTPFLQIFDKIPANWGYMGQPDGWAFMGELYKKTRRAVRISQTDQDKRDFFYETLCDFTRKDWIFFCKAWGINISNISSAKMAAKYDVMNQEIWKYNPMTRTGGDTYFNPDPYAKSNWSIVTFSTQEASGEGPPNGLAASIIDGQPNTFWHSQWSGGTGNPPHFITINLGASIPVKGFAFTQRQSLTRNIKNIRVEVSTNGTTWTAAVGSPYPLLQIAASQPINLAATINCQYIRITVPSSADVFDGSVFAALGEFDVIKP